MKSGASVNFQENTSVDGVYKASLFKELFSQRKALLEKYPGVKKGLAFPEPCLRFGSAGYTFKTTDVVDKVNVKDSGKEFQARYKKDTGKFDVVMKQKVNDDLVGMLKYEERGTGQPTFLVGAYFAPGSLYRADCKLNCATGMIKASTMVNLDSQLPGLVCAADLKVGAMDLANGKVQSAQYNIGASYASPAGKTCVGVNNNQTVTVNHSLQVDKDTTACVELCQSLSKKENPANPLTVAVGRRIDADHMLRVRMNQLGQVNACLEKKFSPNMSVQLASAWDVNKKDSIAAVPGIGFKIITKA